MKRGMRCVSFGRLVKNGKHTKSKGLYNVRCKYNFKLRLLSNDTFSIKARKRDPIQFKLGNTDISRTKTLNAKII